SLGVVGLGREQLAQRRDRAARVALVELLHRPLEQQLAIDHSSTTESTGPTAFAIGSRKTKPTTTSATPLRPRPPKCGNSSKPRACENCRAYAISSFDTTNESRRYRRSDLSKCSAIAIATRPANITAVPTHPAMATAISRPLDALPMAIALKMNHPKPS